MSLKDVTIKEEYRSFTDDLVEDFYTPLLKESVLYQRAVGFFSSSALIKISTGIDGLVENGGKIQIVASPNLSQEDIDEINKGYEIRKVIEKALLREINPISQHETEQLSYIASLIANGILDIKIAFLSSKNEIAMYHEKMGLMTDTDGNVVAFSGSMNESGNALENNYESFDVFCSWTDDKERVFKKQNAFKAIWEDYEPGIETIDFPEAVKGKIYSYNENLHTSFKTVDNVNIVKNHDAMFLPDDFKIRSYQEDAKNAWKAQNYRGIFDMATGTGKTLTALASIEQLYRDNGKRLAIIIVCPYQHLVEQWVEDLVRFGIDPIIGYSESKQKKWKKRLEQAVRSFNFNVIDFFCFITTIDSFITKNVHDQIIQLTKDTVFVADEAHNMGARTYKKKLPENINYRLALSATIDRYNDEEGTAALREYFGKTCIEYSLRQAIADNKLTGYYYYPIITYLDESELDDYMEITKQIAASVAKGKDKADLSDYVKNLLIKRSQIIAGAKGKLFALKDQMEPFVNDNHILIYCGTAKIKEDEEDQVGEEDLIFSKRQIDLVSEIVGNDLNMRVGRFTSQEDAQMRAQIREDFTEGISLQALVAIKCLDEGVNIPSIKTAFILASSTNPKEYIQRRGRVLRKAEGKNFAVIYDFVTLPFPIETVEMQSQAVIDSTRGLVIRELKRMNDFAELAKNPAETNKLIFDLKHKFNITEEDIENKEGNDYVV